MVMLNFFCYEILKKYKFLPFARDHNLNKHQSRPNNLSGSASVYKDEYFQFLMPRNLFLSCPQAPSISSPIVLLTVALTPSFFTSSTN